MVRQRGAAHGKADPDGSAPTAKAGPFGSETGFGDKHARVSPSLRLAELQCLWPLGARCHRVRVESQSPNAKQWRPTESERERLPCAWLSIAAVCMQRVCNMRNAGGRHTISLSDRRSWLFQFSSWLFSKSGSCNSRGTKQAPYLAPEHTESVAGALTDRLLTYSLAGPQPPALGKG